MDPPPSNSGCLHFQSQVECNTQSPGHIPAATDVGSAVAPPKRDGTAYTVHQRNMGRQRKILRKKIQDVVRFIH